MPNLIERIHPTIDEPGYVLVFLWFVTVARVVIVLAGIDSDWENPGEPWVLGFVILAGIVRFFVVNHSNRYREYDEADE